MSAQAVLCAACITESVRAVGAFQSLARLGESAVAPLTAPALGGQLRSRAFAVAHAASGAEGARSVRAFYSVVRLSESTVAPLAAPALGWRQRAAGAIEVA